MIEQLTALLPNSLLQKLRQRAAATGLDELECLHQAVRQYLHPTAQSKRSLFVSAPVNALLEGIYQEDTTIADIQSRGDFGLGTFNDLDGEMLVLDGVVYQLRADGKAYQVSETTHTPFACVTFFTPDTTETIEQSMNFAELQQLLARMLPSPNMLYAIRIAGDFSFVRTRSVPRQENYRPLVEVAREQAEFSFENVSGVMAGFWAPQFMESLVVPGYHLHFLTAACDSGGHLLECHTKRITIGLQHLPRLEVGLPVTLDYLTANFTRDVASDLDEAEH